jgi:uncharacterized membrane protein
MGSLGKHDPWLVAVILAIAIIVFSGMGQAILVSFVALVFLVFGIQLILTGAGS